MPPGMTMRPLASITRPADSAASAPGAVTAAMVSPAIATSHSTTPWGVTTSPPRMIVSSILPPEGRLLHHVPSSIQALIHAVLVGVNSRGETAGTEACRQPREAFSRHFGRESPNPSFVVAPERVGQKIARHVWVERGNNSGQFLWTVIAEPRLHAPNGAHHRGKRRAVARDAVTGRQEGRIDRGPAVARRIEDVADARLERHRSIGLEHLRHVERPTAQGLEILRHGPVGHALKPIRIDAVLAQIVLQAQPRGR